MHIILNTIIIKAYQKVKLTLYLEQLNFLILKVLNYITIQKVLKQAIIIFYPFSPIEQEYFSSKFPLKSIYIPAFS